MSLTPMTTLLATAAEAAPDAPSLTVDERTLTRSELLERAREFALAFDRGGVERGDFVSILLPTNHDFLAAAIGAYLVAATPQPLSRGLAPAELTAILALTEPAVVVIEDDDSRELDHPTLGRGEVTGEKVDGPLPDSFRNAVAPSWKAPTSGGSTGRPKVIVAAGPAAIDLDDDATYNSPHLPLDSTVVIPAPLYHNAPFTWGMLALLRRNHLVLSSRFDPRRTLEQIQRHRATYLYAVPTMMQRISRLPIAERESFDLSSLTTVMHLASACPAWLKEEWMDRLGDETIYELYAGTEAQARTVITGPEWRLHRGSVGRPFMGEFKILGEDGKQLEPGQVGDIYMRSDPSATPTYRYLGAEAKRIEGGWETLGDIGWLDPDGYLYLADRRADLILRGGANIYPAEVEAAIESHPAALEAVVVGLPDEDLGERVHALIRADGDLDLEGLNAHLATRISKYKLPSSIELVGDPLRDDSGKVRRSLLRE